MGLCPKPRDALPAEVLFAGIKSTQKCAPGTEFLTALQSTSGELI